MRARSRYPPRFPPTGRYEIMGFRCGIVGLPNDGKSTLFNALTETAAAQAANYPFCTIEPNVGQVEVPDPRLDAIAAIASSAKIVPTQLAFVDIAGLVKGASKGVREALAIIRAVVALAKSLGMATTAEGVETEAEHQMVQDMGCTKVQGYYFGRPLPVEEARALANRRWDDAAAA